MALLWTEGFDYVPHAQQIPNSGRYAVANMVGVTSGPTPRTGSACGQLGNTSYLYRLHPSAHATQIVGFAYNSSTITNSDSETIVTITSNGVAVLELCGNSFTKTLRFRRRDAGASVVTLGTSSGSIWPGGVWCHIQVKATVNSSTGSFEVRVNGTNVLSATGVNTQSSHASAATGTADGVIFGYTYPTINGNGAGSAQGHIDDVWMCDGSGSSNNDFLGDCKIATIYPNGAGTSSQFTPSAGSNWQNVDETTPNDDTDYNESNTSGHRDLYAMGDLTGTPTVYGVKTISRVRKTDAGASSIYQLTRSGGTTYQSSSKALSTNYMNYDEVREVDPATSTAWTYTAVNALESGVEVV